MKFCPYCGASLLGGAVSFCAECGKGLPNGNDSPRPHKEMERKVLRPPRGRKRTKRSRRNATAEKPRADPPRSQDESYDGYYDDIPAIDAGRMGDHIDPELVKRIVLLIAGAVGIIILAAALMSLL